MFQRLPRWPAERELETIMYASMPSDCRDAEFGDNNAYNNYEKFVIEDAPYTLLRLNESL